MLNAQTLQLKLQKLNMKTKDLHKLRVFNSKFGYTTFMNMDSN